MTRYNSNSIIKNTTSLFWTPFACLIAGKFSTDPWNISIITP